jgi:hypothetical protein
VFELRLLCGEDQVEALGDALEALDALSVSVEDADAQTDAEQALFGVGLGGEPACRRRARAGSVRACWPCSRNAKLPKRRPGCCRRRTSSPAAP